MDREVEVFVRFCGFERRLAELTCRAYERDVGAVSRISTATIGLDWQHLVARRGARRAGRAPTRPRTRSRGRPFPRPNQP